MARREATARQLTPRGLASVELATSPASEADPMTPPMANTPAAPTATAAPTAVDRLIHERHRLGIISSLAANPTLTHNELKHLLGLTDGNLSIHARKLEEAGYIECEKTFANRLPRTAYRLTTAGREALGRYLDHMEALIQATRRDLTP